MCYGHAQVLAEQLHGALERLDEDGGGFQGVLQYREVLPCH